MCRASMIFSSLVPLAWPTMVVSSHCNGCVIPHVKNSKHFVEMMKDVCLAEDEMLVSFDVVSLFTNVPIEEAVDTIEERLRKDVSLEMRIPLSPERIAELLELCLRSTYVSYNGEFYEQMGELLWVPQCLQ